MAYITTDFKEFLKQKLHEKITYYEQRLEQNEVRQKTKSSDNFFANTRNEFEKLMKEYDDL